MTTVDATARRLIALGAPNAHPAGAVVGVQSGDQRDVATAGWARLPHTAGDDGEPMARETLLDLASVTKVAATTVLAMQLVAARDLSLDDPVHRYLPSMSADGKADMTVEHLLTHTAGLRPWWPLYCRTDEADEAIALVQGLPLEQRPGRRHAYSDLGMMLAGAVVETILGTRLSVAFDGRVARPLGLRARYGPVPARDAAVSADSDAYEYAMISTHQPYAVPFHPADFTGWRHDPLRGTANDGNAAHALGGVAGHAGLFASVDDLLTLGQAVRSPDVVDPHVLSRFARAAGAQPSQAVGFRRRELVDDAGELLTVLEHPGFTGTYLAIALERPLVLAGGATRLHGPLGGIPSDEPGALPAIVPTSDIVDGMWAAARSVHEQDVAPTRRTS